MSLVTENKEPERKPNVQGEFDCHVCTSYAMEAYYDRSTNIIYWTCKEGHESKIEEFEL